MYGLDTLAKLNEAAAAKHVKPVIILENRAWHGVRAHPAENFEHKVNSISTTVNFEILGGVDGFYVTLFDIRAGTGEDVNKRFATFEEAKTVVEGIFDITLQIKDSEQAAWKENIKYALSEIKRRRGEPYNVSF